MILIFPNGPVSPPHRSDADAELRLITCGGTFDPRRGSYLSNTIVYAVQVN
jgi:hypothetical protein